MSEWKEPEWTYVYNLMARNGERPVRGLDKLLRYCTAREIQRARIVTTADAAHQLLAEMESAGVIRRGDIVPQQGGKITSLYTF